MDGFNVNTDMFGRYAKIPTGFSNELHTYKIVCMKESNSYCDVPLGTSLTKETWHDKVIPILQVIHCGIDETKVERVALKDCKIVEIPQAAKRGRWEYDENAVDFNIGGWCCSECGTRNNNLPTSEATNPYQFSGSNYCPQCGAKMGESEAAK